MKVYAISENKCLIETYSKEELDNKLSDKKILTLSAYLSLTTGEPTLEYELDNSWFDEDGFLNYYLAGGWVANLEKVNEPYEQDNRPPHYYDTVDTIDLDYRGNNKLQIICHGSYGPNKYVVCRLVFMKIKQ